MTDLLAARSMMAFSLGFHIIFAAIGMTMPFFMAASHYLYLKHKKTYDLELTKMWLKGVAILFATGAVSGTVLSFELGLLWPKFMEYAGPIIGMPFSWEGTAFFLEAIAIGIFIYGWNRIHPWVHWGAGLMVGIAGFMSGVFVLAANAWMNNPQGFDWVNGEAINIDPVKAMFNPSWFHQSLHMQLAAFQAVGFLVAGIHAYLLLKNKNWDLNLRALKIAMLFGGIAAILQPFSGHLAAERVAEYQPLKLAAMKAHFQTQDHAPLVIAGIANVEKETVDFAIEIPGLLSLLAYGDINATVKGLDSFDKSLWPPVLITSIAFQVMVAIGFLMAAFAIVYFYWIKKKKTWPKWLLWTIILQAPLGFIALEAGWIVTEVGRQPWIIYNFLKTADALTPKPGIQFHFYTFLILYIVLFIASIWLMRRQIYVANKNMEGQSND